MRDQNLARKLEGYGVILPFGFENKITTLCESKMFGDFAKPIIYNIEGVKNRAARQGKQLTAQHVAGIIMTSIFKMIEQGPSTFSKDEIITAIDLCPMILESLIANELARRDTIAFYWSEMSDSKNKLESFR